MPEFATVSQHLTLVFCSFFSRPGLRFALPDNLSAQQIRTIALSKEVNLRYFDNGDVGFSIDECMAFGDGGNDIAMLKAVGTGIAMGNSSDEVKAAADYVTTSVDEDGIYNGLRHFGII